MLLIRVLLTLISSLSDNRHVSIGALMCTMVILLTIHYMYIALNTGAKCSISDETHSEFPISSSA